MAHVFQCNIFQQNVFQNDCGGAGAPAEDAVVASAAGGYAQSWKYDQERKRRRDLKTAVALVEIRHSPEYLRLKRKLRMLEAHLEDDNAWYVENEIKEKIEIVQAQIEKMEAAAVH